MLKTFSITDIGRKRKVNQDYIYTSEEPVGNLPNVFIVADGMGGHNAGDYASKVTVETMLAEMQSSFEKNPTLIYFSFPSDIGYGKRLEHVNFPPVRVRPGSASPVYDDALTVRRLRQYPGPSLF